MDVGDRANLNWDGIAPVRESLRCVCLSSVSLWLLPLPFATRIPSLLPRVHPFPPGGIALKGGEAQD